MLFQAGKQGISLNPRREKPAARKARARVGGRDGGWRQGGAGRSKKDAVNFLLTGRTRAGPVKGVEESAAVTSGARLSPGLTPVQHRAAEARGGRVFC